MTDDERCARCGNPLPGANPDELDVCVPCATIVSLEVEVEQLRAQVDAVRVLADKWEYGALRWADPLPVPSYVDQVRRALAKPESLTEPVDLVATLQASVEAARERRKAEAGGT